MKHAEEVAFLLLVDARAPVLHLDVEHAGRRILARQERNLELDDSFARVPTQHVNKRYPYLMALDTRFASTCLMRCLSILIFVSLVTL